MKRLLREEIRKKNKNRVQSGVHSGWCLDVFLLYRKVRKLEKIVYNEYEIENCITKNNYWTIKCCIYIYSNYS